MQPLVSVIIPLFNCQNYIIQAVESVFFQNYDNIEVIIVNDGSTDESFNIVKSLQLKYKITLISQKKSGAASARNRGLEIANGKYIQFLDADDFISKNKIKDQVNLLNNVENKVSVCSTIHFNDNESVEHLKPSEYEDSYIESSDNPAKFLIKLWGGENGRGSMIQPNSWLTPKKIIDKAGYWNEELTQDDDGDFFCRVLLNSSGILKCNSSYNYYRKHNNFNNLSSKKNHENIKSLITSTITKKNELFKLDNSLMAQKAIQRQFLYATIQAYPQYPDLVKLSETNYTMPMLKEKIVLGGNLLNFITLIFGWKVARFLQFYYTYLKFSKN